MALSDLFSFSWNYREARNVQSRLAFLSARSFFYQVVITREWNTRHGGLYAPVTSQTTPNPYLDVPMRDLEINENLQLSKINPAFMTRQISEIAQEKDGIQFHITSLNPIRPVNRPTARETAYLKTF